MKNTLKKILSVIMVSVIAITSVNVNTARAEEDTITAEEKYADILGLYKTVDETIELLIERVENYDLEKRTYFIKTKDTPDEDGCMDTSWWSNIVDSRSGENISLGIYNGKYDFKIDNYYYYSTDIKIYLPKPTSEEKKEYEEKVKYVEQTLGLFSNEMCDYEKAAIIYKYIINSVYYSSGLFDGKTAKQWENEVGNDEFIRLLKEGMEFNPLYGGQTAYEALVYEVAVCGGYARLYNSMLADMEINCLWMITEEISTSVPHAFNLVEIGNKWYYCDPTNGVYSEDNTGRSYLANFLTEERYLPDNESTAVIEYYNIDISENHFPVSDYGDYKSSAVIFNVNEYKAPTCTEEGVYDIDCDYCGDHHRIIIPKAHYYTYTTTKEATCTEEGSGTATCTLCGDTYDYTIPAKGHKWTYRSVKMNCETDGYEKVYCEDCDEVYWNVEEPACGHNWSEWVTASLTQYKRTCSNCNEVQYELKKVIDGTEETTTVSNITEEDKTPKDRGYGVIAYYDENSHRWVYYDTKWESYLPAHEATAIWSDELNANVYWDNDTHTFITLDEYLATLNQGSEADKTTADNPAITTTTTKPITTTTTVNMTDDVTDSGNNPTKITEHVTEETVKPTIKAPETTTKAKKPAKVTVKSAKNNKKKSVTLTWKKTANAVRYQIQYSLSKKFKKVTTKETAKLKFTVKKLRKNKKYYFRVRAVNGNVYGKWSKVKKVTVKK